MKYIFLILFVGISNACISNNKKIDDKNLDSTPPAFVTKDKQISEYVVETFEDTSGNLWFGTLAKGVAKYDGNTLKYYTMEDGLPSNRVVSIIEDGMGNMWFGTEDGISTYDGLSFKNFGREVGLLNGSISALLIDSQEKFWIGTWDGVYLFDGTRFERFAVPYPAIDTKLNQHTKNWVTSIFEDSKGNIWFGRDGYGACRYDGADFFHLTNKDKLYSNNVQTIEEDNQGNLYFGTRINEKDDEDATKRFGQGGLNKWDGTQVTHFPEIKGLSENDVYEVYKDASGQLWIGTISNGVYTYDGSSLKNYPVPKSIMSILKDKKDKIWLGCAGGLYRLDSKGLVNVTTDGPWE